MPGTVGGNPGMGWANLIRDPKGEVLGVRYSLRKRTVMEIKFVMWRLRVCWIVAVLVVDHAKLIPKILLSLVHSPDDPQIAFRYNYSTNLIAIALQPVVTAYKDFPCS